MHLFMLINASYIDFLKFSKKKKKALFVKVYLLKSI